ncbi:amidohydrolase family protein [Nostoc sp.]|uniref:amidohydrolase family protein n=1 Tax=Nostoc sp. TaxID=1180 RepID=UPI002FF46973
MSNPARIDVHQHIVPPAYANWLTEKGIDAGGLPIPQWSVEAALKMMDEQGIATGIVSVSTPGVHLGNDAEARSKAREVNEFVAQVVRDRPDRFGFFATLTLPDVEGAIAEAAYALDELHAAGVILLANTHGRYLGEPDFDPLMAELNRRHAVVFVHPSELPGPDVPGIPPFAADFLLDTTRAAINLTMSGTMDRYTNLKVILSHAGGFVPYAAHRIAPACASDRTIKTGLKNLRRFYFDTALSGSPTALPSLLAFADPSHILYGSDYPYAPVQAVSYFTNGLDTYQIDPELRTAINRSNAEALLG